MQDELKRPYMDERDDSNHKGMRRRGIPMTFHANWRAEEEPVIPEIGS